MHVLLRKTDLLDFGHLSIVNLISANQWISLPEKERIQAIYNFVRDDISFGYNTDDAIPASKVLADGYGQCNTKAILLMALFRAVGVPCRLHGFTVDKAMQRGAMKSFYYALAPSEIVHSWVEIIYGGIWYNLEGFILDTPYLHKLQKKFPDCAASFCGYGVGIGNFRNPPIDWDENDTYIQKEAILRDLGLFDSPDIFFASHAQALSPFKAFAYRSFVRHLMNRNISRIRNRSGRI